MLAAGLALLAAGCQPLPQPFRPDDVRRAANPLLDLPDGSGILVRPVSGMPAKAGDALAREMAEALLRRNVPAFTDNGNRSSYVLNGEAHAIERYPQRTEVRVIWRVSKPDGGQVGEHALDIATRRAAWTHGSPGMVRDLATQSAGPVAALIQDPAPVDATKQEGGKSLYVWPIDGAPKPAGALLRAEMETALRQRSLRVASAMKTETLSVLGTVSMAADKDGKRRLSLEWTVMRADGLSLGTLRQSNLVTPEQLEEDWPDMARAIAGGAAEGLESLLDRTPADALDAARK